MSANIKDTPGHKEHLDKVSKKQFANEHVNDLIKKIIEKRQKDEYLRTSKHSEGLCYGCEEYTYVLPGLVDVCGDCYRRRNKEAVLAIACKSAYGYCFFCKGMCKIRYKYNWAQVNARMCLKCMKKVREATSNYAHEGLHNIDPFWKYARKRLGKDYNAYFQPSKYSKKFWKK